MPYGAVERTEELMQVIQQLMEIPEDETIVVEGLRDRDALRFLGIEGNITVLNDGHSIVETCESMAESYSVVHILTDWDRKGGQLGRKIIDHLKALGVRYSMEERRKLAYLCKKDIKDVESLPDFIEKIEREEGITTRLWKRV